MANLSSLTVNDVTVEWNELPQRKEKACEKCKTLTQGRMRVTKDSQKTSATLCMTCFPAVMAAVAFKPIGDLIRAVRAALAGGVR
jgi:hypothetical protein